MNLHESKTHAVKYERSELFYLHVRAKQGEGAGGGSRVGLHLVAVFLVPDFSTDSVPTAYTVSMI